MFFDVLVWLAVAKIAVLLLEDASYAVRGKQSPRMRERARHRSQDTGDRTPQHTGGGRDEQGGSGTAAPPGPAPSRTGWGQAGTALGGYVAGLVEDATANARARRRRKAARRRGAQAVDGVVTDLDADGGWYADCDRCDWSSRRYRLEYNARAAGAEHTRTDHPELEGGGKEDASEPTEPDDDAVASPARPKLRVIPGGADDNGPATRPARPEQEPKPGRPEPAHEDGPRDVGPATGEPAPVRPAAAASAPAFQLGGNRFDAESCRWCGNTCTGRFVNAGPHRAGLAICDPCAARLQQRAATATSPKPCVGCGTPTNQTHLASMQPYCPRCAESGVPGGASNVPPGLVSQEPFITDPEQRIDAERMGTPGCDNRSCTECWRADRCTGCGAPVRVRLAAEPPAACHACQPANQNTDPKEIKTVNMEATGPEEIRSAFRTAVDTTNERREEVEGVATALTEAADRYESLQMAPSTVGHIRDAAETFTTAHTALAAAAEHLEAALSDFNAHDGQVADTVTDTGNLADKDVLVGG